MEIKYMKSNDIEVCKGFADLIFEESFRRKRKTVPEVVDIPDVFHEMALEAKDVELEASGENLQEEDAANAEKIYEAMKGLTLSQASDERIWAAYALGPFKDYIIKRWNPQSSSSMMDHCFFMQSPHRSLYRQGISRLWWIARVTRDSAPGEDPYRLTKFVFTHTDIVPSICEQPVCQNLEIMHGVIQTLYDFEQKYQEEERENIPVNQRKGIRINKAIIQDVGKYLNFRAGTYLLDLFTKEKICAIVQKRLMKKWGPSKKSAV